MQLDGFLNQLHYLLASDRSCDTARQIWNLGSETGLAILNDYCIAHDQSSVIVSGLMKHEIAGSSRHVGAELTHNGYGPRSNKSVPGTLRIVGAGHRPSLDLGQAVQYHRNGPEAGRSSLPRTPQSARHRHVGS